MKTHQPERLLEAIENMRQSLGDMQRQIAKENCVAGGLTADSFNLSQASLGRLYRDLKKIFLETEFVRKEE